MCAASHNTFFNMMAELKDPGDFPKALALLQSIDMCLYIVSAVVIYIYSGDGVSSPALGSAGPLMSKVAYGIALPTVCLAAAIGAISCPCQVDGNANKGYLQLVDRDCWCHPGSYCL